MALACRGPSRELVQLELYSYRRQAVVSLQHQYQVVLIEIVVTYFVRARLMAELGKAELRIKSLCRMVKAGDCGKQLLSLALRDFNDMTDHGLTKFFPARAFADIHAEKFGFVLFLQAVEAAKAGDGSKPAVKESAKDLPMFQTPFDLACRQLRFLFKGCAELAWVVDKPFQPKGLEGVGVACGKFSNNWDRHGFRPLALKMIGKRGLSSVGSADVRDLR